jgi:Ni/Fe-hydrogenase subunit HybB-like protein
MIVVDAARLQHIVSLGSSQKVLFLMACVSAIIAITLHAVTQHISFLARLRIITMIWFGRIDKCMEKGKEVPS